MGQKFNASPDTPVFVLRVTCDGAAFVDDDDNAVPQPELARILRAIADRMDQGESFGFFETLRDVNGNACGSAAIKPAEYWKGEWPTA